VSLFSDVPAAKPPRGESLMSFESPGPEPPSPIDGWSNSADLAAGDRIAANASLAQWVHAIEFNSPTIVRHAGAAVVMHQEIAGGWAGPAAPQQSQVSTDAANAIGPMVASIAPAIAVAARHWGASRSAAQQNDSVGPAFALSAPDAEVAMPAPSDASAAGPTAGSVVDSAAAPASVTVGAPGGLQITLDWDASVVDAPTGFEQAVEAAAQFYCTMFDDPVSITLEVGWGEITQDGNTQTITDPGEALGGPDSGKEFTYQQVIAVLLADASSAADFAAIASLEAEAAPGAPIYIASAQEEVLGLLNRTIALSPDGSIGFSAPPSDFIYDFNPNDRSIPGEADFIGIAEHEIAHALGRFSPLDGPGELYYSILDLFRFASPGTRELVGGDPAYFSIDGGVTNLDNFDTTSDDADWNGANGPDSYNAVYTIGTEDPVTSTDVTEMNVLGFTLTADANELPTLWVVDANGDIGTLNPANGAVTVTGAAGASLTDIAFNQNGQLSGVSGSAFYAISTSTGAATLIGNLNASNGGIDALAFGSNNVLYAASSGTQQLYEINIATGQAVALSGILPSECAGGLAFDDGQLYMTDTLGNLDLLTVSGNTVTASVLFSLGYTDGSGLAAGRNGILYGTVGSQLLIIDPQNGAVTPALSYGGKGLATAAGIADFTPLPVADNFNGAGTSDILWRNSDGQVDTWQISNGQPVAFNNIGAADGTWSIAGTGAFYGYGSTDILWRNADGAVDTWTMSGGKVVATNQIGFADNTWQIAGTGDFYGNGTTISCGATAMARSMSGRCRTAR
jgi:hypothetical protein